MKRQTAVFGRWPLAVGRWPLAVGRWPLAVGLSLGILCAFKIPEAEAYPGYWEIVPLPLCPFRNFPITAAQEATPEYKSWLAEVRKRYTGENTYTQEKPLNGASYPAVPVPYERNNYDELPLPLTGVTSDSADTRYGTTYWWNNRNRSALGAWSMGGAASHKFNGTVNAVLRYHPSDNNDHPVDPVFLRVNATAHASSFSGGYESGSIRIPSAETAQINIVPKGEVPANPTSMGGIDSGYGLVADSSTMFYVKFSPKGHTQTNAQGEITAIVPLVSFDLRASLDGDRKTVITSGSVSQYIQWNGGVAAVLAKGNTTIDNLSLSLSRSGARQVTSRNDPNFNAARDEYVDDDGVQHGHTIYSYVEKYTVGPDEPIPNVQTFSAGLGIPYGMTGQWQWNPSSSDDSRESHRQEMPLGSAYVQVTPGFPGSLDWTGTQTKPQQKTISYSFTNGSLGVDFKKQYMLTVHDAFEVEDYTKSRIALNPRPIGDAVTKTSAGQEVTLNASNAVAYSLSVGFSGEFGKKIADLLPVVPKVSVTGTKTGTTTTGYSTKVGDLPLNFQTWIEVADLYDRYSGTANEWNAGGFVANNPFSIDVPAEPAYTSQIHVPYVSVNPVSGGAGGVGG